MKWLFGILVMGLLLTGCGSLPAPVQQQSCPQPIGHSLLFVNISDKLDGIEVICFSDRPDIDRMTFNTTWVYVADIKTRTYYNHDIQYDVKMPEFRAYDVVTSPPFQHVMNYSIDNDLNYVECRSDIIHDIRIEIWDEGYHETKRVYLPPMRMRCMYEPKSDHIRDSQNWKCDFDQMSGSYGSMYDLAYQLENKILEQATR